MIYAAGILYIDTEGRALFLKRTSSGDAGGTWCFPGGGLEDGENALEAACREFQEETGQEIDASCLSELTRRRSQRDGSPGIDEVDYTTFVCKDQPPFAPQLGPLDKPEHVAWAWAPIDSPPQPLHPGCVIALARCSPGWTELDTARAIQAGELVSPQKFENIWLFAVRITGTGVAYRHKWDEYVWRDKSLYLNDEFLARCNGLPVVLEHPTGNMLNSAEFKERVIGTILLPYIRGEEVWGIAKIYDSAAADIMCNEQLSTSPAVVWRDPDVNSKMETEGGQKFLVEGKPSLLDHLAICMQGVWDKGGEPTGVETALKGATPMPDDVKKVEPDNDLAAVLGAIKAIDTKMDSLTARLDSVEAKVKVRKDDDEDDDKEKKADRKDEMPAALKAKIEGGKSDDDDDPPEDKKDDDEDDDKKADADVPENFKKDRKDSKRADAKGRKDAKRADAKRADAKAKDDDDPDDKKDDDDDEGDEPDDEGKAKPVAADKRRKDDDDDAKRGDTRGDSVSMSRRDYKALMDRLDSLETKMPKQLKDEEYDQFAAAQARADAVYSAYGNSAPRPLQGESLLQYRRRLLNDLKQYSEDWKNSDLRVVAVDEASLAIAERQIFAAADAAVRNPASVPIGILREIKNRNDAGHTMTTFVGSPISWMNRFAPTGRAVTKINQFNKGGLVA